MEPEYKSLERKVFDKLNERDPDRLWEIIKEIENEIPPVDINDVFDSIKL